jgi:hypothetical protein
MATLALALLAMSCSKSNTQTVTITFPDWQQLQATTLEHQSKNSSQLAASDEFENVGVISVTVNGQPTKYTSNGVQGVFPWSMDSHLPIPKSVTFQADKGALVQAVAIIENQGARQFFYGDASVGNADTQTLDLYLSNAYTTGVAEGNLVGRYITGFDGSTPVGPTGMFQYRFQPPGGKPSMVVTTSEMFSGWVNVTTFGSNILTFTWPDGTPVFAQSIQANDDTLISPLRSKRIARLLIPESYAQRGDGRVERRGANLLTIGYFGPQADTASSMAQSLRVCYPTVASWGSATPIQNLYKNYDSSTQTFSNNLVFAGSLDLAAGDATLGVAVIPNKQGVRGGSDDGACASGSAYTNYLTIDPQRLESNDEVIGVKGPFVRRTTNNFVDTVPSALNTVGVNWSLAPGAAADLGGFTVFWRAKPAGSDESALRLMDGYACSAFRSMGFNEVSVGATAGAATISNLAYSDLSTSQIVVCPRAKDGSFYKAGAMVYSGGGGPAPATQIIATSTDGMKTTAGAPKAFASGACVPLDIVAANAAGVQAPLSSWGAVAVQSTDPYVAIYDESTCTSGVTTYTIPAFSGFTHLYVKDTYSIERDVEVMVTPQAPLTSLASSSFYGHVKNLDGGLYLKTLLPSSLYAQSCVPVSFVIVDSVGTLASPGVPATLDLGTVGSDFKFYYESDPTCSGSTLPASLSLSSAQNSYVARVKYVGAGDNTVANVMPAITGITAVQASTTVRQPGVPVRIQLMAQNQHASGSCQTVSFQLVDANGHPTTQGTNLNLSLGATVAGAFTSSGCMYPLTGDVTIPAGSSVSALYGFAPNVAASGAFNYTLSGQGSLLYDPYTITIVPAPATRLVFVKAGDAWTPGSNQVDYPVAATAGTFPYTLNFQAYAVTEDGRIADGTQNTTAYTRTLGISSGTSGVDLPTPSSLVMTNGSGVLSLTWNGIFNAPVYMTLTGDSSISSSASTGTISITGP